MSKTDRLRLFGGGVYTETNVFSPVPTGLRDFQILAPGGTESSPPGGSTFDQYERVAEEGGHTYVQGFYAFAEPSGITTASTYEALRDRLLRDIEAALPLDGVLLTLHGAMVAEGFLDCETDIAERVRALVGNEARVGVLLDLHCDIAPEFVDHVDVVVVFKEYPHVDMNERAEELGRLTVAAALGEIDPVMALHDCRMLGLYVTPLEPMRGFVDRMSETERQLGVLSVSLGHSFPWGDSVDMGVRALVVADGDTELAQSVADQLGRDFFAMRHEVSLVPLSMTEALDKAFSMAAPNGPVIVADMADNAGGGAPSDSTFVLRELLQRGAENTAIASFWDPIAVDQAVAAGVGATLKLRLGGKMGPASGNPLDLTVTVEALVPKLVQRWPQGRGHIDVPCGAAAWLRSGDVDVIVQSIRSQVFGLEVFTALGLDPTRKRVLVVKSLNHFRAAYAPIASDVIYMNAPGALTLDFASLPYRHLDTNKYPWVDDPWQA